MQRETACGRTKLGITLIELHMEVISGKTLLCGPPNAISQPLYPLGLFSAAGFVWPCNLSSWERKSHEKMKNRNAGFFFYKNPLRRNLFSFRSQNRCRNENVRPGSLGSVVTIQGHRLDDLVQGPFLDPVGNTVTTFILPSYSTRTS